MNWFEDIESEIEKELKDYGVSDVAFGVKITLYFAMGRSSDKKVVYYNKGFRFDNFKKWTWYFQYRAAVVKCNNPKYFVELETFRYELKSTEAEIKKRRLDIIKARRRKVTIAKNNLLEYEKKYNKLFPIEYDLDFIEAKKKVSLYEDRLKEVEDKDYKPKI